MPWSLPCWERELSMAWSEAADLGAASWSREWREGGEGAEPWRSRTGVEFLKQKKRMIESLSLTFHDHDLIVDSELELNYGRRYGLLGLNGCGKSTLLTAIGCRELPIPEHMGIYHLSREIEASDMSALQAVICCDEERVQLEKEAEILAAQDDGGGEVQSMSVKYHYA